MNATALCILVARIYDDASPRALACHLAVALDVSVALVDELHAVHSRQWALEDRSRSAAATVARLAAVKRDIDACNGKRHRLINAIDSRIDVHAGAEPLRFYSETPGELIDRLLILDLKLNAATAETRDSIQALVMHLAVTIAQLIDDMTAARAALPRRVGVKIYGGEQTWAH